MARLIFDASTEPDLLLEPDLLMSVEEDVMHLCRSTAGVVQSFRGKNRKSEFGTFAELMTFFIVSRSLLRIYRRWTAEDLEVAPRKFRKFFWEC